MTSIYKAQIITPFGEFTIAVDSDKSGAKSDMYSAANSEFSCHIGMLRVKNVRKSNRRILKKMNPIKNAKTDNDYWAWIG